MKKNALLEKRKTDKEGQDAKRKALQQKFVSQMKIPSPVSVENATVEKAKSVEESQTILVDQLRKETKRLEKQLRKQEEQLRDERKSHQRTKRKLEEKAQKLFEAVQVKVDAVQEKKEAEGKVADLMKQMQDLRDEMRKMERELERARSAQIPDSDLSNEERLQFTNTIMQLEKELDREKNHLQKPAPVRATYTSITSMLHGLEQALSIDTVQHFLPIHAIAEEVRKLMLFKKRPEWYHEVDPIVKKKVDQSMLFDFGYISQRNDQWVFCNLMNIPYHLELNFVHAIEDAPAKVVMVEGIAYLKEVYIDDMMMHKEISELKVLTRKNQINKPENEHLPHPYFGDFHVLFVGEQLTSQVVDAVEMHGVALETNSDPVKDLGMLHDQVRDANLIIVSKDHVPHEVYSIVNKEDRRVEIMTVTQVDRLITRIRTAAVRLGLMDMNTPNLQYKAQA